MTGGCCFRGGKLSTICPPPRRLFLGAGPGDHIFGSPSSSGPPACSNAPDVRFSVEPLISLLPSLNVPLFPFRTYMIGSEIKGGPLQGKATPVRPARPHNRSKRQVGDPPGAHRGGRFVI